MLVPVMLDLRSCFSFLLRMTKRISCFSFASITPSSHVLFSRVLLLPHPLGQFPKWLCGRLVMVLRFCGFSRAMPSFPSIDISAGVLMWLCAHTVYIDIHTCRVRYDRARVDIRYYNRPIFSYHGNLAQYRDRYCIATYLPGIRTEPLWPALLPLITLFP